jgi:hypothetical protein
MNLYIPYLMAELKNNTEEILKKIDADDDINKRYHEDLVIANGSKGLLSLSHEHQLYAKGIVYKRNPYQLISMPLLKMYNYMETEESSELAHNLKDTHDVVMTTKEDGFMLQIFEHEGKIYLTTRSSMEEYKYVDFGREILKGTPLLDPEVIRGKTVMCECVSYELEGGLNLHNNKYFSLLSIFDHSEYSYWSSQRVKEWGEDIGVKSVDIMSNTSLRDAQEMILSINDREDIPEGGVVCFEKDGIIEHRIKMKTRRWIQLFMIKNDILLKNISSDLWKYEIKTFDDYVDFLVEEGRYAEEFTDEIKMIFDQFQEYLDMIEDERKRHLGILDDILKVSTDPKIIYQLLLKEDRDIVMGLYNKRKVTYALLKKYELFNRSAGIFRALRMPDN